jgi:hypothetical protein
MTSFLKKGSKKPVSIPAKRRLNQPLRMQPAIGKSFLVLFFKKELLP